MNIEKPLQLVIESIGKLEERESHKFIDLITKFQNVDDFGDHIGKPETYKFTAWDNVALKLPTLVKGDIVLILYRMNGYEGTDNQGKKYYSNSLSVQRIKKI